MLSKQKAVSRDISGYVLVLTKVTHHIWDEFRSFMYLSYYGKILQGRFRIILYSYPRLDRVLRKIIFANIIYNCMSMQGSDSCRNRDRQILVKEEYWIMYILFLDFQIKSIGRGDSFHDREGMDLMIGSFESCNAHSCFP